MGSESKHNIRWFRNCAPYINAHRGKTFVVMFGGEAALHRNFANIIHDLALLNSLGVRLVLLHGARPQIAARLAEAGLSSSFHNGIRVTDSDSLPHVQAAVGTLRCELEALFSTGLPNSPMQGAGIRVCSGNFVTARPRGIVDGVNYHLTGQVRRIDAAAILQNLNAGSIVLLSPLGYSPTGEVFNLALEDVAVQTASAVDANKLILFGAAAGIADSSGQLIRQCDRERAAQLLDELTDAEQLRLLGTAQQACAAGVPRCQIISYTEDCALLQELFTHDGSGTLVSSADYEQARAATIDDVGGILELIEPLEREGILAKRSRELLEAEIGHFRVLERDNRIIACAALYPFAEHGSGEIACIVTHPDYRGGDRGQRLLDELEQTARELGLSRVFVLTTQTSHWFIEQGFAAAGTAELPPTKQLDDNCIDAKVFLKEL